MPTNHFCLRSLVPATSTVAALVLATGLSTADAQPQDPSTTQEPTADAVSRAMDAASAAFAANNHEASLQHYTTVLREHPDHPRSRRAAVNIGYVLSRLQRYDEAQTAFRSVVETYPDTEYAAEAQTRLGYIALAKRTQAEDPRQREDLRNEAAQEFAKAVRTYPHYPSHASDAYAQYAGIFFEWGMLGRVSIPEVQEVCSNVTDYFPDGARVALAPAHLMLAETYLAQRLDALALDSALTVIAHYPNARTQAAFAHWVAAQALERLHPPQDALDLYHIVIDGDYTEADNFRGRDIHRMCAARIAFCHKSLGDCSDAGTWFRYVADRWPDSPVAETARTILPTLQPAM